MVVDTKIIYHLGTGGETRTFLSHMKHSGHLLTKLLMLDKHVTRSSAQLLAYTW